MVADVTKLLLMTIILVSSCGTKETTTNNKSPKKGAVSQDGQKTPEDETPNPTNPDNTTTVAVLALDKTTASEKLYVGGGAFNAKNSTYISPAGVSSEFLINAPPSNSKDSPNGLLVYLHGDGAGDYRGYWSQVQKVAAKYNMIALSVLSPQYNSWYKDGKNHGEFLDSLLRQRIFREYNIQLSKIAITGASGGPQFLTGQFLPAYGNNYPYSIALPVCGGGGTVGYNGWIQKLNPSAEFKQYFRLHYHTGTSDFLFDDAKSSFDYYQAKGITQIKFDNTTGNGHCTFNEGVMGVVDGLLAGYIK